MGNTVFSSHVFSYLYEQGANIVACVTSPDKPAGRGLRLQSTPVKIFATKFNLPIIETDSLHDEKLVEQLMSFHPDLFIVIAFRKLPDSLLKIPRDGSINLHMSLLPAYRGAAPIHWAIIHGEEKTGLTTFILNNQIDAGDIIHQTEIPIEFDDTHDSLEQKMMHASGKFMVDSLNIFYSPDFNPIPQIRNNDLSLAPKLTRDNTRINWNHSSVAIYNFIRGLYSRPMAWTTLQLPTSSSAWFCKIHEARLQNDFEDLHKEPGTIVLLNRKRMLVCTADKPLEILSLQIEGKKKITADEFIRGYEKYLNHARFT